MSSSPFILFLSLSLLSTVVVPFSADASSKKGQVLSSFIKGQGLQRWLKRLEKSHPLLQRERRRSRGLKSLAKKTGAWPGLQFNYQREQALPSTSQDVIGLQIQLPISGRTIFRSRVAKKQTKQQQLYLRWLTYRVKMQFLRAYLRWSWLHKRALLSKKLWKQLKGFRPLLSARIKGGTLAAMELTRFSLELEQQRQLLLQTLSQASRLESQLKRWLRLSAGQRLTAFSRLPTPAVRVSPSFANPHPLLAYWKSVISSNQAKTRLQQALAWKDLSLSVAYLNQSTQGVIEHGFVVGVSLPLPLFQRNQTGIRRAVLKTRLSRMQLQQTRWRLKKLLRFRFQQLQQTQKRLQQFEQRMSPRLPGLLRSAKVLFQGKGSLTTLLNVIRALSQYQKTGLRLRYQISLQALALQEVSGHALP